MMKSQENFTMELIKVLNPDNLNLIFGQSHFIKTVEDIHETLITSVPDIEFGLAFSEASGTRLIRTTGTSKQMIKLALANSKNISCGHTFFLFLKNAYPINVLNDLKRVPEVVRIYAATANPMEVIIARSTQSGGVMGVIDGGSPLGVETEDQVQERKDVLRKMGYKL